MGVISQLRRRHRHVTPLNAVVVAVVVVLVGVFALASVQVRPTAARLPEPAASHPPPAAATPPPRRAVVPLPSLPRLPSLIQAAVLVSSSQPLSPTQVRGILTASGASASLVVALGDVDLGQGRTRALAADPVQTRVWTPATTGRATAVWQRAVLGEAVVAHAVAKANGVPLGGAVLVRRGTRSIHVRVGAFATTQLPGIGLVLNAAVGGRLGLVPGTGLLLAAPSADPAAVAAVVSHLMGRTAMVESVLSAVLPSAGWVPPAIGPITSPFGIRIHPITHLPQFHDGIDIGAPLGAPVYAMTAGQVLYAGPAAGFGNEIILAHTGGVTTVYGHVSQILVTSGAVKTGQVIALVGSEGESTGPHLHAEIHVQDQPVDPVAWLEAHGVRIRR